MTFFFDIKRWFLAVSFCWSSILWVDRCFFQHEMNEFQIICAQYIAVSCTLGGSNALPGGKPLRRVHASKVKYDGNPSNQQVSIYGTRHTPMHIVGAGQYSIDIYRIYSYKTGEQLIRNLDCILSRHETRLVGNHFA